MFCTTGFSIALKLLVHFIIGPRNRLNEDF